MLEDETRGRLNLSARVLGVTERSMHLRGLLHLFIAIRIAEPVKIEGPDIKTRFI
jgi:hypothetical protein